MTHSTEQIAMDWAAPEWRAQAHAWIEEAVVRRGRTITAPIAQPHVRAWSTVLRVPTDAGEWYFKAVAPVLAHEVALTVALQRWIPHATLPLLAVDPARGWMLMPDGGARLREIIRSDLDRGHWERILPRYAEAQIALAPHVPEMLATGTPDRRLDVLPGLYTQLLDAASALAVEPDAQLRAAELAQLRQHDGRVRALCAALARYPIPETLHHGDLHDGNIFLRGASAPDGGAPLFFDWGDASVTHPLVSLRTVFVSVEITFDLPEGGGADPLLRDAYLAPWQRFATRADLLAAFELAQRLAPLVSALSWYRAVARLPEPQRREQGGAVHHLLREFLRGEAAAGSVATPPTSTPGPGTAGG